MPTIFWYTITLNSRLTIDPSYKIPNLFLQFFTLWVEILLLLHSF
jgi:hypothetical protein